MLKRLTLAIAIPILTLALALFAASRHSQGVQAAVEEGNGAFLQVAHLAPFAMDPGTAVTVTLDGAPVLTGFEFADSTGYLPVPDGSHLVEIFPAGSPTPAITATVDLISGTYYSAIAVGDGDNQPLALLALEDDLGAPASGSFKLRLGHLAPFSDTITGTLADVRLQDGTPILENVPFGAVAGYLELPAGAYDLKITTPGGGLTLIDPFPATFNDGDIVSAFAVGEGTNQPLGVFAWPANTSGSLLDLAAYLEVGHLAPFAMDPGTAVTVTLDGAPVLTGFEFAASTGYLTVTAGSHLVEIFPQGSVSPAISATVDLMQAREYSAIAIGDGSNQPLAILALEDDNAAPMAGTFKLRLGHLAPFSDTISGTLADVRLEDGTPVLENVPYGAVADYLELPAGSYDLKITTPGGTTTLINPLPATFNPGDIVSAFAVGEGANQPYGVFAWPAGVEGSLLPLGETPYQAYLPFIASSLTPAQVRVAHASPDAPAVDVLVNGSVAFSNAPFGAVTDYAGLPPASYDIEVVPAGQSDPVVISATLDLQAATDYTIAAVGELADIEPLVLVDDNQAPAPGNAHVRFVHASPDAPAVDIAVAGGPVLFANIAFKEVGDYLPVAAGTYDLEVRLAGTSTVALAVPGVVLEDGRVYTVFAMGLAAGSPPLQAVLTVDNVP